MKWCLVWMLLALSAGQARPEEEEGRIEQLVEWQESPLDLLRADERELTQLPGVDADLAEAILALRELRRLESVEDLLRVPGMLPSTVDALRPYVRVGREAPRAGLVWRTLSQHREGAGGRTSHRFGARARSLEVFGLLVDDPDPRWRAAVRVGAGNWGVAFGQLRLGRTGGILDPRAGRSRVGPAAQPRPVSVSPRTDSSIARGWTALSVAHPGGFVFAGRGVDGEPATGGAFALSGETVALHGALRVDEAGWAADVNVVRSGRAWFGLTSERDARSARLGVRLRGQHWRVGLDGSATDGPLRMASDSLTGHRLDRAHRCVQMHGRLRGSGWSVGALWRELARGDAESVPTVEFEATWRGRAHGAAGSVSARMRAAPDRRLTVLARRVSGGREWRVRYASTSAIASRSESIGAELRAPGDRHELRLTAVAVDGTASRVWMLSRPGTGIYPVWVRPPGALIGAGWGFRAGGMAIGTWAWLRCDARRSPEPAIGVICSVQAGRMVRRLQGSVASGTGAPLSRSPRNHQWRTPR